MKNLNSKTISCSIAELGVVTLDLCCKNGMYDHYVSFNLLQNLYETPYSLNLEYSSNELQVYDFGLGCKSNFYNPLVSANNLEYFTYYDSTGTKVKLYQSPSFDELFKDNTNCTMYYNAERQIRLKLENNKLIITEQDGNKRTLTLY